MKRVIAFFAMAATLNAAHGMLGHTDLDSWSPEGFRRMTRTTGGRTTSAVLVITDKAEAENMKDWLPGFWAGNPAFRRGRGVPEYQDGAACLGELDDVALFFTEGAGTEPLTLYDGHNVPKTNVSSIQLLLLSAVYARHIKLLCYVGGDKNNELKLQQVKQLIHWKQSVVTYQSGTTECMRLILEWRDKLGPGNQLTTLLQEYRNTVGLVSFKNGQAVTIDAATGRQIGIADRSIVIQVVKTPPTNLEERHRDAIMNFVISGNTKVSLTNRPLTEDEMMLLVDGLIAFSVEFAAGSIREDLEMGLELADVKTPSDLRSWQDTVNAVLELSSQVQYGELALRNTAAAIPGCPDLLKDKFMAVLSMAKWHAQAEYGRSMATFTNPEHSMLELSWAAGVGRVRLNSTVADALRTGARRAGEKADELERRLREQARTAEDVLE